MGFEKGHPFYQGGEKGWFKKGVASVNKGKKLKKDNLCIKCKKNLALLYTSYCNECCSEKQRIWRSLNREKSRESAKLQARRIRRKVIEHYGSKCRCCREGIYEFLSIDHVDNDGAAHRKIIGIGRNIYYWLIKNNYPEGFQVLCFNCNLAKGHWGKCPHNILTTHI